MTWRYVSGGGERDRRLGTIPPAMLNMAIPTVALQNMSQLREPEALGTHVRFVCCSCSSRQKLDPWLAAAELSPAAALGGRPQLQLPSPERPAIIYVGNWREGVLFRHYWWNMLLKKLPNEPLLVNHELATSSSMGEIKLLYYCCSLTTKLTYYSNKGKVGRLTVKSPSQR